MIRALSGRWLAGRAGLLAVTLSAAVSVSGCDRPEDPMIRAQREAAYRQACAAGVLARSAESDYETISLGLQSEDELVRMASNAALTFNQAYLRHAEIRLTAYAHMDSAVNHAKTSADSTAFAERALSFAIAPADEGSLEAAVINNYDGKLQLLLLDRNHPCNWDFPF
ncbi:MAG: hypothetical protein LBG44_04935 [Gemmatimonadota bacterium]|jgi:hypothetical protein|nr:hypothetical protein [Gemmatimonadota bacterium]